MIQDKPTSSSYTKKLEKKTNYTTIRLKNKKKKLQLFFIDLMTLNQVIK